MRFSKPILAVLLLVTLGCSKSSKPAPDPAPTPDPVKLKAGDDANHATAEFPPGTTSCQKFYILVHWADRAYLTDTKVKPMERLQKITLGFLKGAADVLKVNTAELQKKEIKDGDCSVMEALADKLKNNAGLAAQFDEKPEEFDSLEFIYENIMEEYASSFDGFSYFDAPRYRAKPAGSSVASGLRLLNRADYHSAYADGKVSKEGRKPLYLYVMYSPDYLSALMPKFSKIYKINGKEVKEMSYDESLQKLSEYETDPETKKHKKAKLSIKKWDIKNKTFGELEDIEVELQNARTRETDFELISEKPRIGYIHIATFNKEELDVDFLKTWVDYLKSDSGKLDGTIIDLRNNLGGMLDQTLKIAETILPTPFTPVSRSVKRDVEDGSFKPTTAITSEFFPIQFGKIIILTNNYSASAAELLTAALQDYGAALVVGEPTYGKGIGQKGLKMDDEHLDGTLHITNFYVFSPTGRSWYLDGLQPDIKITEKANDGYFFSLGASKAKVPGKFDGNIKISDFDVNAVKAQNKVSKDMIDYLKTVQADPNEQPPECTKTTFCTTSDETGCVPEEKSCIQSWGLKLLQKWIEKEPAVQNAE